MDSRKADVEQIMTEFVAKEDHLGFLAKTTKQLLEQVLLAERIKHQSIQARVKSKTKLREKYLDPEKNYTKLDDITDQVGLLIITYYKDEVDRIREVVKREFIVDEENSSDNREVEPDRFGYHGVNCVCKYLPTRTAHAEYKPFDGNRFEIQITSILGHAWSEIEHPWYDLKGAFPDNIKRRFARMSALLEIAEDEFLSLRKLQSDYQRSVEVQVTAKLADLPIDALSMRSFVEQDSLVNEVDKAIADIRKLHLSSEMSDRFAARRAQAAILAGMKSVQEARGLLEHHRDAILRYARAMNAARPPREREQQVPGVSIQLLSSMLVNIKGVKATADYYEALGLNSPVKFGRQVAIARAAMRPRSHKKQ